MSAMAARSNTTLWTLRGLSLVVACWFVGSGLSKLVSAEGQVANFIRWGYPTWFRYVTGLLELSGAALLLVSLFIPRLAAVGAALIAAIMCGAIYTRAAHQEAAGTLIPPVLLLAAAIVIGWLSRDQLFGSRGREVH
jgi:putative oxidoreductase